jgi:hypothetical protein
MDEHWGLRAIEYCSDVLWVGAEPGDERWPSKKDAITLLSRNPGKFKRIGTWVFDGKSMKMMNTERHECRFDQ